MSDKEVVKGIQILNRYRTNKDATNLACEHDVLYAEKTDKALPEEVIAELIDLGWQQASKEIFSVSQYDQDEYWEYYL